MHTLDISAVDRGVGGAGTENSTERDKYYLLLQAPLDLKSYLWVWIYV